MNSAQKIEIRKQENSELSVHVAENVGWKKPMMTSADLKFDLPESVSSAQSQHEFIIPKPFVSLADSGVPDWPT